MYKLLYNSLARPLSRGCQKVVTVNSSNIQAGDSTSHISLNSKNPIAFSIYTKFQKHPSRSYCTLVPFVSFLYIAQYLEMWPIIWTAMRSYAPYITLPFAGLIGFIGYNLENILSDKYTPYNNSIKEQRKERELTEEKLQSTENVEKLKYSANVLGTNLSPSLSS